MTDRNCDPEESHGASSDAGLHPEPTQLRFRAEERAKAPGSEGIDISSPEKTRRMLHELRSYQSELEMQNEELRRAQAELDASRARYFDLYNVASVGYCTLSEEGQILEANFTAANLLGVASGSLTGQPLTGFILAEDQDSLLFPPQTAIRDRSAADMRTAYEKK